MLRSLTLLALSACTVASAFAAGTNHDLRPTHKKDGRVYVTLVNKSTLFRDVTIDGHKYTVLPDDLLTVKAPVGTVVYAASRYGKTHSGDPLVELVPSMDHSRISLN
ncbi:MAG: hypothetical protein WCB58_20215 [Acidobacteriaceae bacterium]